VDSRALCLSAWHQIAVRFSFQHRSASPVSRWICASVSTGVPQDSILLVFLPPPLTFSAGLRIWTRFRSALRQGVHRSCVSCLLRRSVIFTAQGPVFLGGCFSFVQSWSPWPFSTFCLDLPPPSSVLISLPASICLVCVFFSLGGYRVAPNSSRPRFCSGASTFLCAHVCSSEGLIGVGYVFYSRLCVDYYKISSWSYS
jgi:hypothetical protein